jgi:hypothetical protein
MTKIEKGSDWRKWDLHFHTPSSYDYCDKSVTNQNIIDVLFNNNISVVAITDHHKIDIDRITELQKLGNEKGILVLPGIEFLSDAKGKVPIHFIGIFSENCNLEFIWGQIENKTNISKIKGEGKEANQVYCDLEDTIKLVKKLGGITTIHAGEKTNSIENITHSLPHGQAQKTEIANLIDIYELGKVDDKEGYLNIVFPYIGKHIPMIICSDNHNINKYILKENCWIKADCTFEGLKQVIYEPKQRVRIQALKPHEKAEYQVIDSVSVAHSDFQAQKIYLNQNLNSIIGGRSTGKSVLLGAIAKKLNCDKEVKFGNEEYTKFVNEVVGSLTVTWKDGIINNDRNIEYFPQSYMYRLAQNKNNELDKLIEEIVRQDQKKNNLLSNYQSFSSENNTDITNKLNKLFQLQDDVNKRKNLLKEKGDEKGIRSEIEKLENETTELKSKISITDVELKEYNELKATLDSISKDNDTSNIQVGKLQSLKTKFIVNKDLEFDLVSLNDNNKDEVRKSFDNLKLKFEKEWENSIDEILQKNNTVIEENDKKINVINQNVNYRKGLETFKNNKQYKELEEKLKIQKDKLADIILIQKENDDLNFQISSFKSLIKEAHRDYYKKIEEIKSKLHIAKDKLEIKPSARLNIANYRELLNYGVNQQSYQGQNIVNIKIDTIEDFFVSNHHLFDKLLNNSVTLKGGNSNISFAQKLLATNFFEINYDIIYEDTFKKMSEGKKAFVVLMLLLDFSNKDCPILIDQPEDDLDNRAIYKDLVKYLKNKKKERQIILVTHNPNIVVGADSELVIVANQNGIDTPNINDSKFQYTSGSLENTKEFDTQIKITLEAQGIKEHVCEILEGGNEAFKQREMKYALK